MEALYLVGVSRRQLMVTKLTQHTPLVATITDVIARTMRLHVVLEDVATLETIFATTQETGLARNVWS
jgi:hypothetical protein